MERNVSDIENNRSDLEEGIIEITLCEAALVGVYLLHSGRAVDGNTVGRNPNKVAMLTVKIHDSFRATDASTLLGEPEGRNFSGKWPRKAS